MADAGSGEERIADLLRQWQESPTPRVGLQLAEEHRRLGRHADARAVLERSLEAHPGHLSSLVALGKTLLDLGEADAAAAQFQRVVERDPTHLVAGKLLIEAHLRRGDGDAARERLDLYRLLNEGDPEIDSLEVRWHELAEPGSAERPEEPASAGETAAAAVAEPGVAAEAGADETPAASEAVESPSPADPGVAATELAPAAPTATAELAPATPAAAAGAELASATPAAAEPIEPPAPEPVRPARLEPGSREPFGPLTGAGDERKWLAGLGGDGIFAVALPPEPEPVSEPEPALHFEPERAEAGAVEEASVEAPLLATVEELDQAAAAAEPRVEETAPAESQPEAAPTVHEPEPAPDLESASVAPEPVPELESASVAPEPVPGSGSSSELEPAPALEPAPEPPVAAAEPPAGEERATNTLGELYLAQGHLADAERVFRAVLARRPDDPAGRSGLAEVHRRRAAPLTAGELLDWARDRGERPPMGGDRRERSAVLLRTYLARLRRRSPADVP